MYMLSEDDIRDNLHELLCDYREVDSHALIKGGFVPQTFTVAQKRRGCGIPFFNDMGYEDWVDGMLLDVVGKLALPEATEQEAVRVSRANLNMLLGYTSGGSRVEDLIYNQEFVDVIRKVVGFTLHGEPDSEVDCAWRFNSLATALMPCLVRRLQEMNLSREVVMKLSIAGGLAGLDLKGAPSASSTYANQGIGMAGCFDRDPPEAAGYVLEHLLETVRSSVYPFFEWEELERDLARCARVVWLTDDYIETYLDLVFIDKTLEAYPDLTVELIPKNGCFCNDMSWRGLRQILRDPVFHGLMRKYEEGRVLISQKGPKMGAANLNKMSLACLDSMMAADLLVVKGCRMHEMLQGGVMKDMYCAFVVCRTLSEIVTGLDSREHPILLYKLKRGCYGFWGSASGSGSTCVSTLSDHKRRLALVTTDDIAKELEVLENLEGICPVDKEPWCAEMDVLRERMEVL